MPRIPIVAGNWKMYQGGPKEALELAGGLVEKLKDLKNVEAVLCPPATAIGTVAGIIKNTPIGLGAQNLYPEASGAFTGEISAKFLEEMGCTYCILGHSERRSIFKESDKFINDKVLFTLNQSKLSPILCCGETEKEREEGLTENVVRRHITQGLAGVTTNQMNRVVIAYEPVWAIGTGKTAKSADAEAVHAFIRNLLIELFDRKIAEATRIQYGGSVKPDNAKELLSMPNIDGALVGGASLKVDSFSAIVKSALG